MSNGMELASPQTAVLLIAHGSRQPSANADVLDLAERLRIRGDYPIVEASFLELAQPDIAAAAAGCVARGAARVILLPYFLSAGVHVQRDLVEAQEQLAARFPAVEFRLAEPLGRHPLLLNVVLDRVAAAATRAR